MRSLLFHLGVAALVVTSFERAAQAAEAPPPPPALTPPLANARLDPSLEAAARHAGIPLYHLDSLGDAPREGDFTVAWIGATDGKVTRQWLLQLRRAATSPAERKAARAKNQTKYLSWGPVVTFTSEFEALDLWIAGPVVSAPSPIGADSTPPIKRRRVFVPSDFLRLGLDNSLRVDQHIRRRTLARQKEEPGFKTDGLYALDKPIQPAAVAYAKTVAERIGFTPETERAWIGGYVALQTFYDLANDVPEIEEIASIALQKPSVWKLAKLATGSHFLTFIGGADTRAIDPARAGLIPVPTEAFDAPFTFGFDKDLIVGGRMVVSHAAPPLDTSAGILGLVAVHPKNPQRIVHVAIISAVRSPAPENSD